jgi:lysozyme
MRISDTGLHFIRAHEGLRLEAYPDPGTGDKPWTIGYGHTGPEVVPGLRITAERAEELLRADVARFEAAVTRLVTVPLSQPQRDALISFAFNLGEGALARSTLLRVLNAGDYADAAKQFDRWVNAGGKPMNGLIRRRHAERTMFESAPALPSLHGSLPPGQTSQNPANPAISLPPGINHSESGTDTIVNPTKGVLMKPVLAALLPSLISAIPALAKIFASGSAVSERNAKAAEAVAEIVVAATGATNLQGAVESIQSDPAARLKASDAVEAQWYTLLEAGGGGIKGARDFNTAAAQTPAWRMPAIWVTGALLVPVYAVVGSVLWHPAFAEDKDIRLQVVTATLVVISIVASFWLGSSSSSRAKDDALIRSADR